mmetsp:Transcript_38176/g.61116  ORF Transcript_38176/g.61116 Transcript_38176/m.61116 type:complete len:223 (+) Transcript_38176:362-1030(+)
MRRCTLQLAVFFPRRWKRRDGNLEKVVLPGTAIHVHYHAHILAGGLQHYPKPFQLLRVKVVVSVTALRLPELRPVGCQDVQPPSDERFRRRAIVDALQLHDALVPPLAGDVSPAVHLDFRHGPRSSIVAPRRGTPLRFVLQIMRARRIKPLLQKVGKGHDPDLTFKAVSADDGTRLHKFLCVEGLRFRSHSHPNSPHGAVRCMVSAPMLRLTVKRGSPGHSP